MSGDIETNPGPRFGADDKPRLYDLQCMSCTCEDGSDITLRLMDRLKPYWRKLAIALEFPQHKIAVIERKDDPLFCLLDEWLLGSNQQKHSKPLTWGTLIEALKIAKVEEEVDILEKHFIEALVHAAAALNFDYTREKSLIQDFIQRQGKVRIRPLRMLLYGPPCTGKTAAMLRLSNQIEFLDQADSPLPSTGLEKPVTVELYPKAQKTSVRVTGVALDHNVIWRHQNLKQQCQILCSRSLHHASSSENFADQPTSSLSATTTRSDGKVARSITGSPPLVDKHLSSLIKAQEWGLVRDELGIEDHTVIHMVDCGGHPEFHEILPLLLEGEALSLLFFNMSYDLDQTFPVVYRGKEGPSIIKYLSEYTTSDVFQRVLTSISAVQLGHQKTPPALLVGTYFDKTDDKHVDRLESAVQKNLKSFIEKDILCPSHATEGEKCIYITILDNMGGEHPWDIDTLREVILDTVEKRFQYQDIPTSWLLLDIFLRSKYEKSPGWCTLDECIAIARDCGITQEELLGDIKKGQPGILHIIHKHYGTLLYFSKIPGLRLKVLCNPNIILHPITKLLIVRFACNQGMIETARRIQDTGEVPQVLMEEACASNSSDPIPTKEIIDLLIHHFILYKNTRSSDGTTRYFIPCLLKPDASLTQDVAHLSPSPIILVPFSTGIVPPGVFSAMVVSLSSDSHEEWILDEEIRFRNRIRFIVHFEGRIFNVEILQHLRFLELRFLSSVPSDVLVKCRRDFWNALVNVMDTSKLNWCWGFYCPGKDQSPHPALYQVSIPLKCAPLQVQCFNKPRCQGHGIFDLERKHTLWFQDLQSGSAGKTIKATSTSEQPTSHSQSMARTQIGSKPTLPHILAFPFKTGVDNIVKKIAGSRDIFGILLLEDDDGSIVSGIAASNQSPNEITLAIVRHWIQGNGRQPISWDTFIDTVRKANLVTLADDIREGLGNLQ